MEPMILWFIDTVGQAVIGDVYNKLTSKKKLSIDEVKVVVEDQIKKQSENQKSKIKKDTQKIFQKIDVIETLLDKVLEVISTTEGYKVSDNTIILEHSKSKNNQKDLLDLTIRNWERDFKNLKQIKEDLRKIGYLGTYTVNDFKNIGADDDLATAFLSQCESLEKVIYFFSKHPSLKTEEINDWLITAARSLTPNKEYRIAILGYSRVGKSTLINSLVGKRLLQTSGERPVTATTIKIFLNGGNKARIHLHNDINSIISNTIKDKSLKSELIENEKKLGEQIRLIKESKLSSQIQKYLAELIEANDKRKSIKDDLDFLNLKQKFNSKKFKDYIEISLNNSKSLQFLREIQDDTSEINDYEDGVKRCHLIKEIEYFVDEEELNSKISLLPNVCIIDAPGFEIEKPHHNRVLKENAEKADCVIIITSPEKLENVKVNDIIQASGGESKKKFYVINKWDIVIASNFDTKQIDSKSTIKSAIRATNIAEEKWIKTDAYSALLASLVMRDEIDGEEAQKLETEFDAKILKYKGQNVKTAKELWEISGVPILIEEVNSFIKNRLRETELENAKIALSNIVNSIEKSVPVNKHKNDKIFNILEKTFKDFAGNTNTIEYEIETNIVKDFFPNMTNRYKIKINNKIKKEIRANASKYS